MELKPFRSPILALALLLAGCGAKDSKKDPPTPEVGYVVVTTQSAPLDIELAGRTTAYETSEVRPQVSGVIKARHFQEGAIVHAGQTLYEIDPSLYRAAEAQAQANLANAEAAREAAEAKAARYRPLAEIEAVSKQDYTDAAAAAKQAAAAVAQDMAALDTAATSTSPRHDARSQSRSTSRPSRPHFGRLPTRSPGAARSTTRWPPRPTWKQRRATTTPWRRPATRKASIPSSTSWSLSGRSTPRAVRSPRRDWSGRTTS
jgi:uncharacterized lipoprotein YbaY